MFKVSFIKTLLIWSATAYSQLTDTLRIYNYEAGLNRWELSIKNNKYFVFKDNAAQHTLEGLIKNENGIYTFAVDTLLLERNQLREYNGLVKSIKLTNQHFDFPFPDISADTTQWYYLDTSKLDNSIQGKYHTGTGFINYELSLGKGSEAVFYEQGDVGGSEFTYKCKWHKTGNSIRIKGLSPITDWFTDNNKFFLHPYYLIGRKVISNKAIHIETYKFFVKTPDN
jgi:hypothetical protein